MDKKNNNQTAILTWIRADSLDGLAPITQVYGICFNSGGEILICRENSHGNWQIPGGHPEEGESIDETLSREVIEEVDVKVKNILLLGAQKVEFPDNPQKDEGALFYQVRCVCEVDEILPQTPDPATGGMWQRMFVPSDKVTEYVQWGDNGANMFADAIQLWQENKI